ncbi:MAG TPA: glycosyltransferase family 39 protein [Vicinamibacterales bacterium]|nr:glycosyltransferase family 39 protein [Vicinamibacterales bacterium]
MNQRSAFVNARSAVRYFASDLGGLVVISATLCVVFFFGFGLGDDPAYDALARQILDSGYPAAHDTTVFAGRPVVLYAIAAAYASLGHGEWSFILVTAISAAVCVGCVYWIARRFGGRSAGLVAGSFLLTSPLHAAYATTMANDIIGSALLGVAACCVVGAARPSPAARGFAMAGGLFAGLSCGTKTSFVLMTIPFVVWAAVWFWRIHRFRLMVWLAAGAAVAGAALLVFFWYTAGDPLAGIRAELAFNRIHILPSTRSTRLQDVLMFYPRLAAGLPAGPPGYQWRPAGFFFLVVAAALAASTRRGSRPALAAGLMACGGFVILEFWPLTVSPYVPIHRLPRFLYPVQLPGAVCVGLVAAGLSERGRLPRLAVFIPLAALMGFHLLQVHRAAVIHQDSMRDVRFAAGVVLAAQTPVVIDEELLMYVNYKAASGRPGSSPLRLALSPGVVPPPNALIVAGGSRRPEMDPLYSSRQMPDPVPADWMPLMDLPGELRPWRPRRGVIYVAGPGRPETAGMKDACPPQSQWVLKDVFDVGSLESESAHGFTLTGETWRGERVFREDGADRWDDGRAFIGQQSFEVAGLTPGTDTCVVKRIDGQVAPQVSRWHVGPLMLPPATAPPTPAQTWGRIRLLIPGDDIRTPRVTLKEEFVSSPSDINAFRVEVYQLAPAAGR